MSKNIKLSTYLVVFFGTCDAIRTCLFTCVVECVSRGWVDPLQCGRTSMALLSGSHVQQEDCPRQPVGVFPPPSPPLSHCFQAPTTTHQDTMADGIAASIAKLSEVHIATLFSNNAPTTQNLCDQEAEQFMDMPVHPHKAEPATPSSSVRSALP